jgi:TetR/AcrR family transcriptional regulator
MLYSRGEETGLATHVQDKPSTEAKSTAKRIVYAALREFGEKGVELTTMDDIAARAGTSKQLVYHYFKNKELLYLEAMDEISRVEHRWLFEIDFDSLPPLEAVERFFKEVLETNLSDEHLFVADQILHYGTGRSGGKEIARSGQRAVSILNAILDRGHAQAVISKSTTATQLYLHMLLLSTGFRAFRPLMEPYLSEDFTSAEATERWKAHAVASVLAAVRPAPTV